MIVSVRFALRGAIGVRREQAKVHLPRAQEARRIRKAWASCRIPVDTGKFGAAGPRASIDVLDRPRECCCLAEGSAVFLGDRQSVGRVRHIRHCHGRSLSDHAMVVGAVMNVIHD